MKSLSSFVICFLCAFCLISCEDPVKTTLTPRDEPWKIFTNENSPIESNVINSITIGGLGEKWISTDVGAYKFAGNNWEKFKSQLEYSTVFGTSSKVNCIGLGKDGTIWFGLAGGGIKRMMRGYSGSTWQTHRAPNLTSDMIYSLTIDINGHVWAGTASGVSHFVPTGPTIEEGIWLRYTSSNSPLLDEPVRVTGQSPVDNLLWFGTYTEGVISYDGDFDWNIYAPIDKPFPIISMTFTYGRVIWFGTYADWAYKFDVHTMEWVQVSDSTHGGGLPSNFVNAMAFGRNGEIWFGTPKGLTRLKGTEWKTWNSLNSPLPDNDIRALIVDTKGNLWIGTRNGLAEFNEEGILN